MSQTTLALHMSLEHRTILTVTDLTSVYCVSSVAVRSNEWLQWRLFMPTFNIGSSSFRQIMCDHWPTSLDWRAVSSGCDLLQPVRTVMSLIVSTVWCCLCIVFVVSRVFAFLQRTLLLPFSLSGSRDLCIGVHSMSVCVCGRAQATHALLQVLLKYCCQFVFPSSKYATFFAKATFPYNLSYVHLSPSVSKLLLRKTKPSIPMS